MYTLITHSLLPILVTTSIHSSTHPPTHLSAVQLVSIEALTVETADVNGAAVAGNKKGSAVVLSERLTALGVHLSTLPVDCRVGKLILMGCMFG